MRLTVGHRMSCKLGAKIGDCNEEDRSSSDGGRRVPAYVYFSAVGPGILYTVGIIWGGNLTDGDWGTGESWGAWGS